jgi:hypothetical protein
MEWAKTVDFMGHWMPHPSSQSRVYLGEYGWSPDFCYFDRPYYGAIGLALEGLMNSRVLQRADHLPSRN